jgi:hypothetical protein
MPNERIINSSNNPLEEKRLAYLYLLFSEFWEVNDLINTLMNYKHFVLDVRESTSIQNALNIAVVISYARNFKDSRGFSSVDTNAQLIKGFTSEEKVLHEQMIVWRDQEYAHSDSLPNDMQVYSNGGYSRKVVRQLLEKNQLETLKVMVNKIRCEIGNQINELKGSNLDTPEK